MDVAASRICPPLGSEHCSAAGFGMTAPNDFNGRFRLRPMSGVGRTGSLSARMRHQQPRPRLSVQLWAQNVNRLPTESGTRRSLKAFASAVMARHPVQWPAAMIARSNSRNAATVSGMIASFAPER
jgi:hypothetical protein